MNLQSIVSKKTLFFTTVIILFLALAIFSFAQLNPDTARLFRMTIINNTGEGIQLRLESDSACMSGNFISQISQVMLSARSVIGPIIVDSNCNKKPLLHLSFWPAKLNVAEPAKPIGQILYQPSLTPNESAFGLYQTNNPDYAVTVSPEVDKMIMVIINHSRR